MFAPRDSDEYLLDSERRVIRLARLDDVTGSFTITFKAKTD